MNDTRYYSVKLTRSAKKNFEKIPEEFKIALCNELISLAGERNPKRWMHRIIGQRNLYSVRSGNYRAIITINDDVMIILVIEVGNRNKIYRKYQ